MHFLRFAVVLLGSAYLCSCSLPGLKYQEGGSSVWGARGGEVKQSVQIQEITPSLMAHMAQETFKARQNTVEALATLPVEPWIYRVGIGDVLSVIVWDHPELTNPAGTTLNVDSSGRVVRPDGTLFYPYAGDLLVAGKTTAEIRTMIAKGISHAIQSPQVDVKVLQYRSQFVNVVGDIDQPCKLAVTDIPMTVIDAMSQCRTIRASAVGGGNGANDNSLYAHRDIELIRGQKFHRADLYAIYKSKDPLLYEPLLGGDTLYIRDDRWNRVFVVGELTRQAAIYVPISGLSLADALNDKDVGGLNQQTADARNIYVFRGGLNQSDVKNGQLDPSNFRPDVFHLDAGSADALILADQFQLQPRDIVFASAAPLVSYSRTASLIIPTISTLLQTGILIHSAR